jgi:hypothetical protein
MARPDKGYFGMLPAGMRDDFLYEWSPERTLHMEVVMPTIDLTPEQVIELIQQLPVPARQKALGVLVDGLVAEEQLRSESLKACVRAACRERGLDWESMPEDERERFVDDLLHEDRSCSS